MVESVLMFISVGLLWRGVLRDDRIVDTWKHTQKGEGKVFFLQQMSVNTYRRDDGMTSEKNPQLLKIVAESMIKFRYGLAFFFQESLFCLF